jgi:hypothetical protein
MLKYLIIMLMLSGPAWASSGPVERLADAIYQAEGGAHTSHPYGILAKYRHTSPRTACINTICHRRRDWVKAGHPGVINGQFIEYMGKSYCPVGAFNDPGGLNMNWVKNVMYYYNKKG